MFKLTPEEILIIENNKDSLKVNDFDKFYEHAEISRYNMSTSHKYYSINLYDFSKFFNQCGIEVATNLTRTWPSMFWDDTLTYPVSVDAPYVHSYFMRRMILENSLTVDTGLLKPYSFVECVLNSSTVINSEALELTALDECEFKDLQLSINGLYTVANSIVNCKFDNLIITLLSDSTLNPDTFYKCTITKSCSVIGPADEKDNIVNILQKSCDSSSTFYFNNERLW